MTPPPSLRVERGRRSAEVTDLSNRIHAALVSHPHSLAWFVDHCILPADLVEAVRKRLIRQGRIQRIGVEPAPGLVGGRPRIVYAGIPGDR